MNSKTLSLLKKPLSYLLLFTLIATYVVFISMTPPASAANVTFYPTEINDVLINPYMGWAPSATDNTSYPQPHTLVYAGITWRDLEPNARGSFDWAGVESKYRFDYWANQGKKIIIRIILDIPKLGSSLAATDHYDIPDWLVSMINNDGYHYWSELLYGGPGGGGFSPNYNNTTLISEHQRMVNALAARYNNDNRIALIQLGSIGHWGEWHTWPYADSAGCTSEDGPPTSAFPRVSVTNQYAQHFINAFTNKKVVIRRPFQIARDNNIGLFNDVFGEYAGTREQYIPWINNGYTDDFGQSHPAMPDFWKYNFSGGEFGWGNPALWLTDESNGHGTTKWLDTYNAITDSHISWLGPCSAATYPVGTTNPPQWKLDELMKKMGYRFVLSSVTHADTASKGTTLNVSMSWNNKGVAPFYYNWPLELSLADSSGNIIAASKTQATNVDIRNWLPGAKNVTASVNIPSSLSNGTYRLCVAILDPATGNPGVNLAIGGRRSDGRYALDTITVSGGTTPTPTPTPPPSGGIVIDGNTSDWNSISPIATTSGQTATSLKVSDDNNYLYFLIQGSNLGPNYELFIDTDSNSSTGYQEGTWTGTGLDYLVENGTLYKSTGSSWSWSSLGTTGVQSYNNTTVCELRVAKSSLSPLGNSIKVGYKDINSGWALVCRLPVSGQLPSYTLKGGATQSPTPTPTPTPTQPPINITIDGSVSDWSSINAIATATGQTATSLKVYNDSNYIYFCVQGSNLGPNYQLYINSDNNSSTGYAEGTWTSSGIDYMIENGTLFKSTGQGWSWSSLGSSSLQVSKNSSVCEIRLAKSAITGLNNTIKVGYKDINSSWALVCRLPQSGSLPSYSLQ